MEGSGPKHHAQQGCWDLILSQCTPNRIRAGVPSFSCFGIRARSNSNFMASAAWHLDPLGQAQGALERSYQLSTCHTSKPQPPLERKLNPLYKERLKGPKGSGQDRLKARLSAAAAEYSELGPHPPCRTSEDSVQAKWRGQGPPVKKQEHMAEVFLGKI